MSNDRVQRGVRSRHSRATGDAPALGRVARMPGVGRPKGERRIRKRSDRRNAGRTARWNATLTLGWSIAIGVLAICSVVAAVVLWIMPMINRHEVPGAVAEGPQVRIESRFPSPDEEGAIAMVRRVVEPVREEPNLADWIRAGEMSWEEVKDFLATREAADGKVLRYEWIGSMDDNDLQIEGVLVHGEKDGKPVVRQAFLTPDEHGVWKMDMPSFARHAVTSWQVLLDDMTSSGVVRVYVGEDYYYNGVFREEREWTSYGLASPDCEDLVVGYSRVGTKQHAALAEIFKRAEMKDRPMGFATVELKRVEGAERRQFEISKVVAEGWVVAETLFEDRVVPVPAGE